MSHDYSKLPAWAREEIAKLRDNLKRAERELEKAFGVTQKRVEAQAQENEK